MQPRQAGRACASGQPGRSDALDGSVAGSKVSGPHKNRMSQAHARQAVPSGERIRGTASLSGSSVSNRKPSFFDPEISSRLSAILAS